jgi:hypothetical protein
MIKIAVYSRSEGRESRRVPVDKREGVVKQHFSVALL